MAPPGGALERVGIVGGGAAGLVTALTLQERVPGLDITVYEREPHAYTTLCGEGISCKTLELFTAFPSVKHCPQSFVGASWWFPGPVEVLVNEPCYTIERATWIPEMAEAFKAQGGSFVTGRKITPEDVPRLAREHDLLVGADGPGSQVRKAIGGEATTRLGIQVRLKERWEGDRLAFYTHKDFSPEYSWVFPKGEILNVGILAEGDGRDWDRLEAFRRWVGLAGGTVVKREAYPIGFNGTKVAHENIVLTGDAAGLTNPLTKGGLAALIHTALLLAECVRAQGESEANGAAGGAVATAYDRRVWAHPVADPSYARALEIMLRWTNEDFERLARFAPPRIEAAAGPLKDKLLLALGLATNPGKARDLFTLYKAMALSKGYSW